MIVNVSTNNKDNYAKERQPTVTTVMQCNTVILRAPRSASAMECYIESWAGELMTWL